MTWATERISMCTLICGDAYEVAPTLQGVEALITDPPYGIHFDWMNASRTRPGQATNGLCRPIPVRWHANIAGDDTPFNPQPWLHYPQIILWGAPHFSPPLPMRPGLLIWDKRDGRRSDHYSDCEIAWTNLPGRPCAVSANLLYGFEQFNLRTLATSAFAVLPAHWAACLSGDSVACATRSARAPAPGRPTASRGPQHIVAVLTRRSLGSAAAVDHTHTDRTPPSAPPAQCGVGRHTPILGFPIVSA